MTPIQYEVKLEAQPTGTVTVMVRGASGDVTVKPSRLIFTTSSWDDLQPVEVKAGQDADGEHDAPVTLTHAASGGGYDGVTGGMVTVTTNDDDPKGVTVTPRALTVMEGSAASSYTVVLTTEPTGTVTVTLGGLGLADANDESLVVNPTTLTFTQRNWNIPQEVTLRAAEDDDGAHGSVTLTHGLNGGGYGDGDVTALDVTVTVRDNDTAGLTVTPTRLQIAQGSSRTYTVALNTKPTANVEVTVASGDSGVTASPTPLDFTPDNWFTARTVTVRAAAEANGHNYRGDYEHRGQFGYGLRQRNGARRGGSSGQRHTGCGREPDIFVDHRRRKRFLHVGTDKGPYCYGDGRDFRCGRRRERKQIPC